MHAPKHRTFQSHKYTKARHALLRNGSHLFRVTATCYACWRRATGMSRHCDVCARRYRQRMHIVGAMKHQWAVLLTCADHSRCSVQSANCWVQERFYFGDFVLPLFESGVPLLLKKLQELDDFDNVTIAYPDEGAWKRFHYLLKAFPEVICTKVRDGAKRIVRLKEGSPTDRHVVIVDDLVQSGGTLIECGNLLHALGALAYGLVRIRLLVLVLFLVTMIRGVFSIAWSLSLHAP